MNTEILEQWLNRGLCNGAGDGENSVCLEQAVALCAGLPLTDSPDSCVEPEVSALGRSLNDRSWSSPKARAKGLRAFAFAQLGTADRVDGRRFAKRVAELVIRELVPFAFRAIAKMPSLAAHKEALEAAAAKCEAEGTEASAREARETAAATSGGAAAAAYAAYYATSAAAGSSAAYYATSAAYYATSAAAAAYAAYAAAEAAEAADYAACYAGARAKYRDEMLTRCADIGARAIKEQMEGQQP